MPDNTKLVYAAMALRSEAPASWDAFVWAVREYSAGVTADMLRCPQEMLQRAQGMALMANDFAMVMNDAPKLHDKMQTATIGRTRHG